jgi:hypothetical protein
MAVASLMVRNLEKELEGSHRTRSSSAVVAAAAAVATPSPQVWPLRLEVMAALVVAVVVAVNLLPLPGISTPVKAES